MKLHYTLPLLALLLPACGSVGKMWPFGEDKSAGNRSNATAYQCDGGKRFQLRLVDNGAAAWLILPDREVLLDKTAGANRYSNGIAVLDLEGSEAKLKDGDKPTYSGCKTMEKAN